MPDPHPAIVHLVIGIFVTAIISELIAHFARSSLFSHVSLVNSIAAAFAAISAVITGLLAKGEVTVSDKVYSVINSHETLGYLVLAASVVFAALKAFTYTKKTEKYLAALVATGLAGLIATVLAAHEGGQLVYKYGVGVSSTEPREPRGEKMADTTSKLDVDFQEK